MWIWNLVDEYFPNAIQIVDLYHAREHLSNLAKIAFPKSKSQQTQWCGMVFSLLDFGNIEEVVTEIRRLKSYCPDYKKIESEAEYFLKNKKRMQYTDFRQQGLFIGSGVVEAGCKTIIGQRLKQSGMH